VPWRGHVLKDFDQELGLRHGWPSVTKLDLSDRFAHQAVVLDRRAAVVRWRERYCCCLGLDYLPPVKRAAIDAWFTFPPGI